MLNVFRENLKSLKWVLYLVIASFIIWAFAVLGGAARQQGSAGGNWAAVVDGRTISIREFQNAARNLETAYRQYLGPEQYQEQRDLLGVSQLALERLISDELLLGEAGRIGLRVTDREVWERIRRDPAFQEGGKFIGKDRYLKLVGSGGRDARDYEERVRRSILIGKAQNLIRDGIQVTESEIEREFRRRNERVSADFLRVTLEAIAAHIPLTEPEIESFFRERQETFRRPERREGILVQLLIGEVVKTIRITDEEIYEFYQANLSTKYTLRNQRRARHILFRIPEGASEESVASIREGAEEILVRARAGEDFSALARNHSEDASAESGGDLGYFGQNRMLPEFGEAVFSMEVGEVSDLVRTSKGFHIIQLLDIQPQRIQSLEEVRERIRKPFRFRRTVEEIRRRLLELRDRVTDAESFRRVAEEAGLTVQETGLLSPDGTIENLSGSTLLVRELFSLEPDQVSEPIILPSGLVLIMPLRSVPGELPTLEEIREQVGGDLRREKAEPWLRERVEEEKSSAEPDGLARIAEALGVEVEEGVDLQRGASLPGIPGSIRIVEAAFDLPQGEWRGPERLENGDLFLLQVTEKKGNPEEFATQKDAIRRGLLLGKQDRHFREVLQRLRQASEVRINQEFFSSLSPSS